MNPNINTELLVEGIQAASAPGAAEPVVLTESRSVGDESEFLFFFKPELTKHVACGEGITLVELVLTKIRDFGFAPFAAHILPSAYLQRHSLLEQHYGVINSLAKNPRKAISAAGRFAFEREFGVALNQANVLGGFEFLARFPQFSASTLDNLWAEGKSTKLGAGTYCRFVHVDGESIYLINGFHPSQIEHYTAPGQCIAALGLRGTVPWLAARQSFVGATDPNAAEPESIRGTLLARSSALQIGEVSQAMNGVHLSAGPVEGLVELGRYLLSPEEIVSSPAWVDHFSFGRLLHRQFVDTEIQAILANQTLPWGETSRSVYDITEEQDPQDCLLLLERARPHLVVPADSRQEVYRR